MKQKLLTLLHRILPLYTAYAHCDVPCGIYDPKGAQTAAATVLKMVEKLQATDLPDVSNKQLLLEYDNTTTRMIMTKEEHAQKCKTELLILWTDYFKPEHVAKFPNLHDIFWKAAKLCSANKQSVDLAKAQELVSAVDEIATIFQQSKASK
jgi:nickel superoxide dismutase